MKDIDIVDMGTGAKRGMVMGDTLQMFVNKATRERPIESLGIPFIAVATQLRTGEVKTFRSGDLGLAVRVLHARCRACSFHRRSTIRNMSMAAS